MTSGHRTASGPADSDHWKWLAIAAWGLVHFISPAALGLLAWMTVGPLAAALIVFICISARRFIFSDRLFQSWQFVAALRGYIVEPMPNVSIRLRIADERGVQLRGSRRSGVFHMARLHWRVYRRAVAEWRGRPWVLSKVYHLRFMLQ